MNPAEITTVGSGNTISDYREKCPRQAGVIEPSVARTRRKCAEGNEKVTRLTFVLAVIGLLAPSTFAQSPQRSEFSLTTLYTVFLEIHASEIGDGTDIGNRAERLGIKTSEVALVNQIAQRFTSDRNSVLQNERQHFSENAPNAIQAKAFARQRELLVEKADRDLRLGLSAPSYLALIDFLELRFSKELVRLPISRRNPRSR